MITDSNRQNRETLEALELRLRDADRRLATFKKTVVVIGILLAVGFAALFSHVDLDGKKSTSNLETLGRDATTIVLWAIKLAVGAFLFVLSLGATAWVIEHCRRLSYRLKNGFNQSSGVVAPAPNESVASETIRWVALGPLAILSSFLTFWIPDYFTTSVLDYTQIVPVIEPVFRLGQGFVLGWVTCLVAPRHKFLVAMGALGYSGTWAFGNALADAIFMPGQRSDMPFMFFGTLLSAGMMLQARGLTSYFSIRRKALICGSVGGTLLLSNAGLILIVAVMMALADESNITQIAQVKKANPTDRRSSNLPKSGHANLPRSSTESFTNSPSIAEQTEDDYVWKLAQYDKPEDGQTYGAFSASYRVLWRELVAFYGQSATGEQIVDACKNLYRAKQYYPDMTMKYCMEALRAQISQDGSSSSMSSDVLVASDKLYLELERTFAAIAN